MAASKRGPKPKLEVWPVVKKSTSGLKASETAKSKNGHTLKTRNEELTREPESTSTKFHQLNRRIPFPDGLPAVADTPTDNLARMTQIIDDAGTTNFFANGGYSNSFVLQTDQDQQVGTQLGGLQGCTILISYNRNNIYFSHHWEIPGFGTEPPHYTKIMFDTEVKGFLTGAPDSYGAGAPLVAPNVATAAQPMHGASTSIITPGANRSYRSASYRAKVAAIAELTTKDLEGTSKTFPYQRPKGNEPTIRVTAEFSAATRHLRVMLSDARQGPNVSGGYRVIDKVI